MKILIEEHPYASSVRLACGATIADVFEGLSDLEDSRRDRMVNCVGYFYNPNPHVLDCVFILPKVLVDKDGRVFGRFAPEEIIDADKAPLSEHERRFLYNFAVWIYRAINVYRDSKRDSDIIYFRNIESAANGSHKKKSESLLDVILSLLYFNRMNGAFFTFVLKNMHSGYNKINWNKTVSRTMPGVQGDSPAYMHPVNKRRCINFDEELLVIFFSILNYVSDTYGFRADMNYGFKLIKGACFRRYIEGYGRTRLRQIKYKYFSDTALKLWDLCYAFFDKAYQIRLNVTQKEYLLVKSFYIVFEAMIDELVGDCNIPAGLKKQSDGKRVDHMYTYEGLISDTDGKNNIYYIGDSKYYKLGTSVGEESVYKQYTYARNVVQWNMTMLLRGDIDPQASDPYMRIRLFDELTEGYDVIPNFFISAKMDSGLRYDVENLSETSRNRRTFVSKQFENRLYDRDTLLLFHYDVNFLFVLSMYARNNAGAKALWKAKVRKLFRMRIRELLENKFDFYAFTAHEDVDGEAYIKRHFQETLGKTFRPFDDGGIYSLALDSSESFKAGNEALLAELEKNFYVVRCPIGENPAPLIDVKRREAGMLKSPASEFGNIMAVMVTKADDPVAFVEHRAVKYVMGTPPRNVDIKSVTHIMPMVSGKVDGCYGIERMNIVSRGGNLCLEFVLGEFCMFGEKFVQVFPKRRHGQLLTYAEAVALYANRL